MLRIRSSNRIFSGVFNQNKNKISYATVRKIQTNTPEDGFIIKSTKENFIVPNTTIDQYVFKNFKEFESKTAIVCGITGRNYTYAQIRDQSAALAVRLQTKLKLRNGETIAICLPNIPEYPIALLGAIEAGLVVTTINPLYTSEEMARQIIDSNAETIIGTIENYQVLNKIQDIIKRPLKFICIKTQSGEKIPSKIMDFRELTNPTNVDYSLLIQNISRPDDVVILPYSSGTTGLPKGVELTHKNVTSNCEVKKMCNLTLPTTSDFQDVLPCVLPFYHIYGMTMIMLSKLALGNKLVTLPKFTPESFLKLLDEHKATVLHIVPPIVFFMANHDSVGSKHVDSIRNVISGAAPMGAADADRLLAKAPKIQFVQGFGLTETSPLVLISDLGSKNYASIGKVVANTEAKITKLDSTSNTGLDVNEIGELLIRGPQVMKGYRNNKKSTKETITKDGWLRTGDVAYYDENHEFYITDRLKELIKVKGYQVPPAELEALIRAHPKILDAGVIGIPHPSSGEVPRAFVVRRPNSDITEKELQDYVAEKVAGYKKLDGGVQFLEAIPKSAAGKILRRELKSKYT